MNLRSSRALPIFLLLAGPLAGCDKLFPKAHDMAAARDGDSGDGGVIGHLQGQVCALAQLHDINGCRKDLAHGPLTLLVQDTGQVGTVAADGTFGLDVRGDAAMPPPMPLTLLFTDPAQPPVLVPALVQIRLAPGGAAATIPMVPQDRLAQVKKQGVPFPSDRGAVLAYALDGNGRPRTGLLAQVAPGGVDRRFYGPLYEAGDETLFSGTGTGPAGLVAVFDLAPGTVTLDLGSGAAGRFPLPVQAGAITFSLLVF